MKLQSKHYPSIVRYAVAIAYLMVTGYVFGEVKRDDSSSVSYRVETAASFAGGENTPFWLVSNIHGLSAPEFNNGYVKGEIFKSMSTTKRFDWGAGAELTGAWNLPAPFAIRQLYAEMHYRAIWVSLGSKNYYNEYNDRRLSSGDLLFSGNAMAIPQLRVGTNGFATVWGTKGWFSVKAYLSYGVFTDSSWKKNWVKKGGLYSSDVLFCGRGLWLRAGNTEIFPLTFDVGIEMGTQFGGTIYNKGKEIKMPSKFIDWIKAIVPLAGDLSTPVDEQTNVQGNMTGEYSISVSYFPTPQWNIRAYWEHYFEDHSQLTFEYGLWKDGLWGLEVGFPKNRFVSKFVYEYVCTKEQTNAVLHNSTPSIPEQISGQDGYYDHYLYGAWANWGMSMGTPLAISPLYNRSHQLYLYDTRFRANHFGIEGIPCDNVSWRFLLTFSRNWGTYFRPLADIMDNTSGLVEIRYDLHKLKGAFVEGALAWDHGRLLGNNFGGKITLGFEGLLSIK